MECVLAWGNACSSALRKTITLQKRAVQTINRAAFNSHTDLLATCTNIRSYYLCMILSSITCPALLMTAFIITMRLKICIKCVNQDNFTFPDVNQISPAKLPLFTFPDVWNKWSSSIPNGSQMQIRNYIKSRFTQSYPSHVKCTNLHCSECHWIVLSII